MLFSEPKIPQLVRAYRDGLRAEHVSVLFSEPKIPQLYDERSALHSTAVFQCSSASRKFLNGSSTQTLRRRRKVSVLFSEPKIPQFTAFRRLQATRVGFSALQRAENSSITKPLEEPQFPLKFQCSSASRKFLNGFRRRCADQNREVSVLFSEPKIPQ